VPSATTGPRPGTTPSPSIRTAEVVHRHGIRHAARGGRQHQLFARRQRPRGRPRPWHRHRRRRSGQRPLDTRRGQGRRRGRRWPTTIRRPRPLTASATTTTAGVTASHRAKSPATCTKRGDDNRRKRQSRRSSLSPSTTAHRIEAPTLFGARGHRARRRASAATTSSTRHRITSSTRRGDDRVEGRPAATTSRARRETYRGRQRLLTEPCTATPDFIQARRGRATPGQTRLGADNRGSRLLDVDAQTTHLMQRIDREAAAPRASDRSRARVTTTGRGLPGCRCSVAQARPAAASNSASSHLPPAPAASWRP
jgi:hypothetical protein